MEIPYAVKMESKAAVLQEDKEFWVQQRWERLLLNYMRSGDRINVGEDAGRYRGETKGRRY